MTTAVPSENWSEILPVVEGSYWVKPKYGPPELVRVVKDDVFDRLGVLTFGGTVPYGLDRFVGSLWFGPLEPPAFS